MSRYCDFIGICWSKYVLDIKDLELRIEPIQGREQTQELICFCYGDYAQDTDKKAISLPSCLILMGYQLVGDARLCIV